MGISPFLPQENLESTQDLMFILVYKLGYSEEEVLRLDRWVAKKRLSQYEKYQKEKEKQMKSISEQAKVGKKK